MRKSIIKSKYALDSFVVLRSLVTTRSRKGFGSFHSEDVEVLIRQSAEQYVCPEVYDEILHASAMDRNSTKENFRFGDAAKSGMFALGAHYSSILNNWMHYSTALSRFFLKISEMQINNGRSSTMVHLEQLFSPYSENPVSGGINVSHSRCDSMIGSCFQWLPIQ